MKRILIDASSAILLYKSELFDLLVSSYQVVMAKAVCRELTREGYPGAEMFARYCLKKRVEVVAENLAGPQARHLQIIDSGLDEGEKATLSLYLTGRGRFVVMDDGRGARYCQRQRVPYINALLVPKILYWSEKITARACRTYTEKISRTGRYSTRIIAYAGKCKQEKLEYFLVD